MANFRAQLLELVAAGDQEIEIDPVTLLVSQYSTDLFGFQIDAYQQVVEDIEQQVIRENVEEVANDWSDTHPELGNILRANQLRFERASEEWNRDMQSVEPNHEIQLQTRRFLGLIDDVSRMVYPRAVFQDRSINPVLLPPAVAELRHRVDYIRTNVLAWADIQALRALE